MFDTLAVARQLAAGGVAREQAEVIAGAIGHATEQGDQVTSDQFKAGLAELRTEIANLDTRLSAQVAELRTEQRTQIAELRTQIAELSFAPSCAPRSAGSGPKWRNSRAG